MRGPRKTIREFADSGYWYHCGQTANNMWHFLIGRRGTPWEAICELSQWLLLVGLVIISPISIPVVGYFRCRGYRRQVAEEQARIDRIYANVSKEKR